MNFINPIAKKKIFLFIYRKLKMEKKYIHNKEAYQQFIHSAPVTIVFKEGTCGISTYGWETLEAGMKAHMHIPVAVVVVVQDRPLSNFIEEETHIIHASPQVIIYKDGQAQAAWDNYRIDAETIASKLTEVSA